MRRLVFVTLALVAVVGLARPAGAQVFRGYGFGGPAGIIEEDGDVLGHFGGGVDLVSPKGLGASFELGRLGNESAWISHFSLDGSYHFLNRSGRLEPFVAAGYTNFFDEGEHLDTLNFGGGFNTWLAPHVAFRFDVRDHLHLASNTHIPSVRFGVTIR